MMDITTYKNKLTEELESLTDTLSELGIHNPQVPEDWIATPPTDDQSEADENIAADRHEDWIERRGEVAELETRYNNIMRALQKIEAGTYGTCEIGGEEIESDRLMAYPAARTCKKHLGEEGTLPR